MSVMYDMYVDQDTLLVIEEKLKRLRLYLIGSAEEMQSSIDRSQDFLAGYQFEKARSMAMQYVNMVGQTEINIQHATSYIGKLQDSLAEYIQCSYEEIP